VPSLQEIVTDTKMSSTASIFSLAIEERARAESSAWARFSSARDQTEFCVGWLSILCAQIDRVSGGVVLLGPDQEGSYVPAAVWPDPSRDLTHLGTAAERALSERRGIVIAADGKAGSVRDQPAHIGYPIEVAGVLHGAVVLDIAASPEAALQRALRQLHWASAWLVDRFRQQALANRDVRVGRLALAMDLIATAVQEQRLAAAALAVANEMSSGLKCDRVSVGLERHGSIKVLAISNTAVFDARMSLVRLIGEAMDEVLDLDAALVWPPHAGSEQGAVAHAELASELRDVAICSVPLLEDGHAIGALTLERSSGDAFDEETIELCKTAGGLLGPILGLKRDNERGALRRMREGFHDKALILFGPRHPGVKLVALVALAIVVSLGFATGTYRVPAKTVVEGAVQRAAVAPFDGHIAQSFVRAGDTVQSGQVLVRLDDRELKLEHARLTSEREQAARKQRQALATQDRGAMAVIAAQLAQTDAQLLLISDKLARATLVAPFEGVVVSGDLNQLLGTPVEQGKLLFQIAPLDAYRVVLEVDERDIATIELGQSGELTLSGLPDRRLGFSVQQITPVASQQDGRNFFRVEAHLKTDLERVRPGMEGIGKITVGERKLIWIWTHSFVDWLRTWAWKELP
jgi:multidrug resistance efflux pump